MNKKTMYENITEKNKELEEYYSFIKDRLYRNAGIISAIMNKKWPYSFLKPRVIPTELEWAYFYSDITIVAVDEETISFTRATPFTRSGHTYEVRFFQIDKKFVHYSDWELGALTRKIIREWKHNTNLQKVKNAEANIVRKTNKINALGNESRELTDKLFREKLELKNMKKSLAVLKNTLE